MVIFGSLNNDGVFAMVMVASGAVVNSALENTDFDSEC